MFTRKNRAGLIVTVLAIGVVLSSQAMADMTKREATDLEDQAKASLGKFQSDTKGTEALFANAKGILVCPEITKGGFIVGVEGGTCALTSGASTPLYYETTAVKAGLLAEVQNYSMILVMNTPEALVNFTSGKREWEVGADASFAGSRFKKVDVK